MGRRTAKVGSPGPDLPSKSWFFKIVRFALLSFQTKLSCGLSSSLLLLSNPLLLKFLGFVLYLVSDFEVEIITSLVIPLQKIELKSSHSK